MFVCDLKTLEPLNHLNSFMEQFVHYIHEKVCKYQIFNIFNIFAQYVWKYDLTFQRVRRKCTSFHYTNDSRVWCYGSRVQFNATLCYHVTAPDTPWWSFPHTFEQPADLFYALCMRPTPFAKLDLFHALYMRPMPFATLYTPLPGILQRVGRKCISFHLLT